VLRNNPGKVKNIVKQEHKHVAKNIVVIGSQWGDEGKGKLVDLLTD